MLKPPEVSSNVPTALKPKNIHPSKLRIIKNLVVLSLSWWMLFNAYDGLVMLQSTLNSDKGIGVISVSVQHTFACLSAVLFPKYFIRKLGCKIVIIASMVSHAPYIASNFYPHWLLMIPSSILLGAANPLIWAAACTYLNDLSSLYTGHIQNCPDQIKSSSCSTESQEECRCDSANTCFRHKFSERPHESESQTDVIQTAQDNLDLKEDLNRNELHKGVAVPQNHDATKLLEDTTACFFGFHGTIYNTGIITSNITSYFILRIGLVGDGYVTNSTCVCGSDFCSDQVACFDTNLKPPSDMIRYILTAVYIGIVFLSIVSVVLFLNDLGRRREAVTLSLDLLMATCKLAKRASMFCLIPVALYIGVLQGFFMGDYTQAYVGCAWGIHNVGLVTATFGLTLALSSLLSGWLVKYVGRLPIFLLIEALTVATIAILLLWIPDAERPAMLFVVSGFMGASLGTNWTQLRVFLGIIFKDNAEAAFGNYQLWHSVGVAVAFGYSKYLCTSIKIYIMLVVSTFGILGYLFVERSHSRSKK